MRLPRLNFTRLSLLLACLALPLPAAENQNAPLRTTAVSLAENPRPGEVVRQAYVYSCGTGAIVNFVALLGGETPRETGLIEKYTELRGAAAAQAVRETGFSLLDLKLLMSSLGYKTAGVRYEAGTMPEDPQPMIVHLLLGKFSHFAVFAGLETGKVVLLDPMRGRLQLSEEQFLKEWDGTALRLQPVSDAPQLPSDAHQESQTPTASPEPVPTR